MISLALKNMRKVHARIKIGFSYIIYNKLTSERIQRGDLSQGSTVTTSKANRQFGIIIALLVWQAKLFITYSLLRDGKLSKTSEIFYLRSS